MMNRIALSFSVLAAALAFAALGGGSAGAAGSECPDSNPPNTLVLVGGSGQTAQIGKAFQANLQVQLVNTNGCPVTGNLAGISVDFVAPSSGPSGIFMSSGSNIAVVGTDAQGIATAPPFTANDTAGSYSVDAESDLGTVNLYLTNTASGLAAAIAANGATSQEASVNSQYAQPLQARVTDANGNPVQSAAVSFAVGVGPTGASASFLGGGQGITATDANGLATSRPLVANGVAGRFTATAAADGVSTVAVYNLDNHAAAIAITAPARTAQATVGRRYARPLRVRVLDSSGQPIEGASVTFTIAPADSGAGASFPGSAGQANELTDVDGNASSPPLVANKTAGSFTATAAITGAKPLGYRLKNLAGPPATVTPGAASGESTAPGSRFPVRLAVTVADKDGNAVSGATVTFTAPAHGASGRFRVHGRRSRIVHVTTNSAGIAIAPPFTANAKTGGYVVVAAVKDSLRRTAFALINERR